MKRYIKPNFMIVKFPLKNVICSSPEEYKEYIDGPGDWGDDPIIDPDDEIDW